MNARTALSALMLSEISWAILLVSSHLIVGSWGLAPFLFSTIQLFAGGIVLVLLSRRKILLHDFILNRFTLLYGLARVGTGAFFTAALVHVTASSASFLGIFNITVGMIFMLTWQRKVPAHLEWLGHIIITLGFLGLCLQLDGQFRNPAVWYMLGSEVCVVISALVAERHPQNQGEGVRERAYLTGALLTTSGFLTIIFATLIQFTLAMFTQTDIADQQYGAVDLTTIMNPAPWIAGALVGILMRGPVVYFSLRAVKIAGAQSYLAFSALLPFLSLLLEIVISLVRHEEVLVIHWHQIGIGIFMSMGSILVLSQQQRWWKKSRQVHR